jgi:hypothetical protein
MLHRMREQFSPAALVLSIAAIVLALVGGAYAANQATTSKAKAGPRGPRGPRGKTGPTGPAGINGINGTNGKDGTAGTPGTNGTNGKSVSVVSFNGAKGTCAEGGVEVEVEGSGTKHYVCNGKAGTGGGGGGGIEGTPSGTGGSNGECVGVGGVEIEVEENVSYICNGEPGAIHPGETLPKGATETGVISEFGKEGVTEGPFSSALSFPIPLASPLEAGQVREEGSHVFWVTTTQQTEHSVSACPGTVEEPTATQGNLCVYQGLTEPAGLSLFVSSITPPGSGVVPGGTGTSGAVLTAYYSEGNGEPLVFQASWAVTAP